MKPHSIGGLFVNSKDCLCDVDLISCQAEQVIGCLNHDSKHSNFTADSLRESTTNEVFLLRSLVILSQDVCKAILSIMSE